MKNKPTSKTFLFGKRNYRFLFLAVGIIALGYFLMAGGGSEDPEVFNPEIFSFRRIRVAPTLVLIGFSLAINAILTTSKSKK